VSGTAFVMDAVCGRERGKASVWSAQNQHKEVRAKMSEAEQKIVVHVRYGGMEKTFTGSVNDVWASVNRLFDRKACFCRLV